MAEKTGIAWCDSTFNPWIGCTKVGPGCDFCYAADQDARRRWDGGKVHWGPGVPRYRTSAANWELPLRWNKRQMLLQAGWDAGCRTIGGEESLLAAGFSKPTPHRVFCASLGDVFDNEVPEQWRSDLFRLICDTPFLTWQLLTKRVGNVAGMLNGAVLPNAWIGATIVNQEEWDRDAPKLLQVRGFAKRFVSYEPALGPVNWGLFGTAPKDWNPGYTHISDLLSWIIVGGESGPKARPFDLAWVRSTIAQCKAAGVSVFCKQLGSNPAPLVVEAGSVRERLWLKDRAGADPLEWPDDLRVREFPE